jgi:hypothetical protein
VSYVVSRLVYLSRETFLRYPISALTWLPGPVRGASVPIKLWDVVGLAAQM